MNNTWVPVMTALHRLAVSLALALFAGTAFADPPPKYPFVAYDEGLRIAQTQKKPIFLYFGRYGCGWCDKTNKEAFSDAQLRAVYTKNYVLVYVDAESGKRLTLPTGERLTEMELGVRFKAFATPLFAYLEPDGKMIFKISGIQSADDFRLYDRFISSGAYKDQDIRSFLQSQAK